MDKLEEDFTTLIEKTLGETEEHKFMWFLSRSVLDRDWTKVLKRDPNISQKPFKEIFEAMQTSSRERNPIITSRLEVLRIVKLKDEQISDSIHRLVEDYKVQSRM